MAKRGGGGGNEGDASAPLFFLLIMLMLIVAPWTFSVVWKLLFPGKKQVEESFPTKTEDGKRIRQCQTEVMASKRDNQISMLRSRTPLFTKGFISRLVILLLLWVWLIYMVVQVRTVLANSTAYADFDPLKLLGVTRSSKRSDIKKAFHKASLQWHPDKNKSPEAPEKFMLVKKAYDALTDPVAKRNYEMYGNPDGPSRVTIGVALPSISKELQGVVLVLFVVFFVLGIPLTLLFFMVGGEESVGKNGVMHSTMEAMPSQLGPQSNVMHLAEMLVASGESTLISSSAQNAEEAEALAALADLRPKPKKGDEKTEASKAELLLLAHLHRRTASLPGTLLEELEVVLPRWRLVAIAMVDYAARQCYMSARDASLTLHRCLVQGLDPALVSRSETTLLQVPYFDAERIKLFKKGKHKVTDLLDFARMSPPDRTASLEPLGLSAQERLDIEEFVKMVPQISIKDTSVIVEGEESICVNDIATLRIKLLRENVSKDESIGAVHTPLFPSAAVPEAWWFYLQLPGGKDARPCLARVTDGGRDVVVPLRFRVPISGKVRCKLSISCESYSGLDFEHLVTFQAKPGQSRHDEYELGSSGSGED